MDAPERKAAEDLADVIAEKVSARFRSCGFTPSEQEAIKDLLRTKRNAVRAFLWICGAVMLWVLKDVYAYFAGHLTFK